MRDFKKFTSYEIACADQGKDPKTAVPDLSAFGSLGLSAMAFMMLCIIRDSITADDDGKIVKANFYDTNEEKWSNWMRVKATKEIPSGSGLSFYATVFGYSRTTVASRLLCQTEEQSEFFFTEHKALWEQYILHRD